MRLLRVRDLDRPGPPDRRATSTPSATRSGAFRDRWPAGGHVGVLRRRHAVAASPPTHLVRVLAAVAARAGAEVTVECNPDTVTAELLATYREAGVNRLSFGVQSMVAHVLAALGRTHDPANVERAVDAAPTAGLRVVQPRPHLRRRRASRSTTGEPTLDGALALEPAARERLRAHRRAGHAARRPTPAATPTTTTRPTSTCSPTSVLGRGRASSGTRSPTGPGPGHECRHNLLYWSQGDYLGVRLRGPLAPSTAAGGGTCAPRSATSTPIGSGTSVEGGAEELDDETRRIEGLQLALRTAAGGAGRRAARRCRSARPPRRAAGGPGVADGRGPPAGQRGGAAPGVSGSQAAGTGGRANSWPASTRSASPGTTSTARLASINRSR